MLEYRDENGNCIDYIGVSPASDLLGLEEFLTQSFDIIKKSSNPNIKTHAFGMTQLKLLEMYPYTSADSTSWKLHAAMGSIYTPMGSVYVSDRGKFEPKYILNLAPQIKNQVIRYINDCGFEFEDAATKDTVRYIINIKYLVNWAKNYEYKGRCNVKRLF